jgi:hypothetical protein
MVEVINNPTYSKLLIIHTFISEQSVPFSQADACGNATDRVFRNVRI